MLKIVVPIPKPRSGLNAVSVADGTTVCALAFHTKKPPARPTHTFVIFAIMMIKFFCLLILTLIL